MTTYDFSDSFIFNRSPDSLGTGITGSVTFGFDTTGLTGTFSAYNNPSADITLTVGLYTVPDISVYDGYFTFTNGTITDWLVKGFANCPQLGCSVLINSQPHGSPDQSWDYAEQQVIHYGGSTPMYAYTTSPGLWTNIQTNIPLHNPAPIMGAGLLPLAILAMALLSRLATVIRTNKLLPNLSMVP